MTKRYLPYIDDGALSARVRSLNIVPTNIPNVRSPDRTYPSEFHIDGAVFESGRVSADGNADFLAEPNPTFRAAVALDGIELDYFKPITNRYNVSVDKGMLSAEGVVESGRVLQRVELARVAISGLRVDYIHTPPRPGRADPACPSAHCQQGEQRPGVLPASRS